MVRGAAAVLLASSLCALTACQTKPPSAAGTASATAGGEASSARNRNEKRELTWQEYYVEIEQRARHSGGTVMWFNPPRLVRRRCADPSDAAVRPPGGSVSDSVR